MWQLAMLSIGLLLLGAALHSYVAVAAVGLRVLALPFVGRVVDSYGASVGSDVGLYIAASDRLRSSGEISLSLSEPTSNSVALNTLVREVFSANPTHAAGAVYLVAGFAMAIAVSRLVRHLGLPVWLAYFAVLSPSTIFWGSAFGKEAWTSLGVALIVIGIFGHRRGLRSLMQPAAVAGFAILLLTRPHIAVACAVAYGFAVLAIGRAGSRRFSTAVLLAAVVLLGFSLLAQTLESAGLDAGTRLVQLAEANAIGGSALPLPPPDSALSVVVRALGSILAVLFMPLPGQFSGVLPSLLAVELWVGIGVSVAAGRYAARRGSLGTRYAGPRVFVLALPVTFAVTLSPIIANLGTLARLRSTIWPILILSYATVGYWWASRKRPDPEANRQSRIEV